MPGLLDIARASEKVSIGGVEIECFGLDAGTIGELVREYEELRAYFSGVAINPAELFGAAFRAVPAIIAAGTGEPIENARRLSIEAQLALVVAIVRVTMPRGVGPFVESFGAIASVLNADGADQPSKTSQKPSKG